MVEKELKKLSRRELLEILIIQTKRVERLEAQLADAQKAIADRSIMVERVGNLAEAALAINGVFEAAQKAAEQYLDNVEIICKQGAIPDDFDNPFIREDSDKLQEAEVEKTEEINIDNLSRKERREIKKAEKKAAREAKRQAKLLEKEEKKNKKK